MDHANAYSFPYFDCWSNSTSTLFTEKSKECEPIVEMPASPELESTELIDDEKMYYDYVVENDEDIEDMMTLNLSIESSCFSKICDNSFQEFDHDMTAPTSLVALHPNATINRLSKMKNASRLKTERLVYVLTDNHPLLTEYPPREHDDPSPYLLVIWLPDELESSDESSKTDLHEEESSQTKTVLGTLLIPCRTAMKACFPLNGTYFQVNEVFADYASMIQPINVPRQWIWSLEKRITYFGTGTSTITRGK
ncbi:transcriptional activator demeter, putative [Medicago truncatula]|uniref:Transcriptional activator demeter, putative n=1 Tax=Medicago truncatula TaxID=3880 RepID=G7INX0_MEDTR|nr:transcriptional activator demeter, putative [Medicago truncatula]